MEKRLLILPQALMGMHARTIIAINVLRQKGRRLPALARSISYHIFAEHQTISRRDERVKAEIDLRLPSSGNFMMMDLKRNAKTFQIQDHLRAQILIGIIRRHREIATFWIHQVAQIGLAIAARTIPM